MERRAPHYCTQILLDFLGLPPDGLIVTRKHHKWKMCLMQLTYRMVQLCDIARHVLFPVLIVEIVTDTFSLGERHTQYNWTAKGHNWKYDFHQRPMAFIFLLREKK